jgi:ATP-dependent DNA helicase RecG
VQFKDLQFVVIDEQHRFGVEQRAALRNKGTTPHLLVMTATPIPRSLALTLYGDLDLSIMDEMPAGRQPIETYVLRPQERERAYSLLRSQVKDGRQAFIIYPLIEESEKMETLKAATEEHEKLQKEIFPELKLGLLHGRMKPDEKDRVMADFRDKKYDMLVSTTVVEVGVDVSNATVMLVENAGHALADALITQRNVIPDSTRKKLDLLVKIPFRCALRFIGGGLLESSDRHGRGGHHDRNDQQSLQYLFPHLSPPDSFSGYRSPLPDSPRPSSLS